MNNKKQTDVIEMEINTDKSVLPRGTHGMRILEVCITAPTVEKEKENQPLNLGIVLDRSGSMHGEKMHYAKQAAVHLIDLLGPRDHAAVVIYDDHVDVVSKSQPMTDAQKVQVKLDIQKISSRGSTCLSGGWLKGCELVAENDNGKTINRTLLLSDGLANVGITNQDELATHAHELFQRGVSTSCLGIGQDYNEHLLEAMANAGGGNFHYLEAMSAIPFAFEREFEALMNIALRDVEIQLDLPETMKCEVLAGWHGQQDGRVFTATIGNLNSGFQQKIYFLLHVDPHNDIDIITLPIHVEGKTDDGDLLKAEQILTFECVDLAEEKNIESDPDLMKRFALVDMADRATQALKRARAGDRVGAQDILSSSIFYHRHHLSEDVQLKYQNMAHEINSGMNEYSFKRRHQEEYQTKRMQMDTRDYQLRLINDHLVMSIEGNRVLVDTGIPVSLGHNPEWYFNHEVHTMSETYMGVSINQISQLVGTPIDLVMGCDILKKHFVTIDVGGGRISFDNAYLPHNPHRFPISHFMGVPFLEINVAGKQYEMFLDTGAKLSYVDGQITKAMTPIAQERDFYPGLGEFETPVYDVNFRLGELDFTLKCGVLPDLLATSLMISGKSGIIGTQIYKRYLVQIAFPKNTLLIRD